MHKALVAALMLVAVPLAVAWAVSGTRERPDRRPRARVGLLSLVAVGVLTAACASSAKHSVPASPSRQDKAQIAGALRTIDVGCATGRRVGDRRPPRRVVSSARTLVGLARRYPRQRFRLEAGGEEGNMLSVLLVARDEARRCSPPAVAVIDRALPPRIRAALPAPHQPR